MSAHLAIFEHRPPRSRRPQETPDLSLDDSRGGIPQNPESTKLRGRDTTSTSSLIDLPLDGRDPSEPIPSPPPVPEGLVPPMPPERPRNVTEELPTAPGPTPSEPSLRYDMGRDDGPTESLPIRLAPAGPRIRRREGVPPSRHDPPRGPAGRGLRQRSAPHTIGGGAWRGLGFLLLLALPVAAYLGYRFNLDPPVVVLSSELLDFGAARQATGTADPGGEAQEVRLANQGEEALLVSEVSIDGDAASEFLLVGENCVGRELEGGAVCRLQVAFRPSAPGPRRARLVVRSNGINGSATVPLLGEGTAPRLALRPEQLSFGELVLGTASRAQHFELHNEGSAPLAVARLSLGGQGAADFVVRRDSCSRQRLAPGESCRVEVVFVPTAEGERRATVEVASDAHGAAPITRLVGRGLPQRPELSLDPERLELGAWPLGTTSPGRVVTLANAGDGPLRLRELRLAPASSEGDPRAARGAGSLGFEVVDSDCVAGPLAPSGHCKATIRFRSRREGEALGLLEIHHGEGEIHRLPLLAVGTAPHAFVDSDRLSFEPQAVGRRSDERPIRLTSSGTAPLELVAVELDGADARAFSTDDSACRKNLAPDEACLVRVGFRPLRDGPHRAELRIRHNGDPSSERVVLSGVGVSARLGLSTERLDFGQVTTGDEERRRLNITNEGRAPLALRRLRLDGGVEGDYRLGDDRCTGRTLGAGEGCAVEVIFRATRPGTRGARLVIEHDSGQPAEVTLVASARVPPKPELEVRPARFDLGEQEVGTTGSIRTLTLRNGGDTPLELGSIRLAGAQPDGFQLVPGSCSDLPTLGPREECTMGIRLSPATPGPLRAEIVILHNGQGGRHTLPLDGRGRGALVPR